MKKRVFLVVIFHILCVVSVSARAAVFWRIKMNIYGEPETGRTFCVQSVWSGLNDRVGAVDMSTAHLCLTSADLPASNRMVHGRRPSGMALAWRRRLDIDEKKSCIRQRFVGVRYNPGESARVVDSESKGTQW